MDLPMTGQPVDAVAVGVASSRRYAADDTPVADVVDASRTGYVPFLAPVPPRSNAWLSLHQTHPLAGRTSDRTRPPAVAWRATRGALRLGAGTAEQGGASGTAAVDAEPRRFHLESGPVVAPCGGTERRRAAEGQN